MKFIITEEQQMNILKKYWDKQVMLGKEPTLNDALLHSLGYPKNSTIPIDIFIDYLGGYDVVKNKVKELLEDKKIFNTNDTDVNTGSYDFSFEYVNIEEEDVKFRTIGVNVKFIDGTVNLGYVEGDLDIEDENIRDVLDNADMSEYFEIKDELTSLMEDILTHYIQPKTGFNIIVNNVYF